MLDMRSPQNGYDWGWNDVSELMLYANFNLLKRFVETEMPDLISSDPIPPDPNSRDFEILNKWHEAYKEMKILYLWWTKNRAEHAQMVKKLATKFETTFTERSDGKGMKIVCSDNQALDAWVQADKNFSENDEAMLYRLMSIRRFLWT